MLFNMPSNKNKKAQQQSEILRKNQCTVCPLKSQKKSYQDNLLNPFDILVLGPQTPFTIDQTLTGFPTHHAFTVECGSLGAKIDDAVSICCMGRKLDLVEKYQPKIVITLEGTTGLFENSIGYTSDIYSEGTILPTRYKNHDFWLIPIQDFHSRTQIMSIKNLLRAACENTPEVESNYYDGCQNVVQTDQIDDALRILSTGLVACDIETYPLRPYDKDAALLSISLSNGTNTFNFPLFHPQTPSSFVALEFFPKFLEFASKNQLIFHNGAFDMEWLAKFLGEDFLYSNVRHDTQAQAYLINIEPNRGKSLDALTRKYMGFNLKKLSNLDVTDLRQVPLDNVLKYNGLDAKYTYKLFHRQKRLIESQNLPYAHQIEVIPAVVLMQNTGLVMNNAFIETETIKQKTDLDSKILNMMNLPVIQRYVKANGVFNPLSDTDVARLHHNYLGVPATQTSFDEEFLAKRVDPVATALLDIRGINKLYSTYLAPINPKCDHKNAGKNIWPDGKIHCLFNTMRTATGRLSSDSPNMQNWPKRDGQVFLRECIGAPLGNKFVCIDYGQIEYRVIAALSKDKKMVNAIINGLDIHGWWANKLDEWFPGFFLKKQGYPCTKAIDKTKVCVCDKCEFKEFRNKCKNGLVFPFCFGSNYDSVGASMGITDKEKINFIGNAFWAEHQEVKAWQEELIGRLAKDGYILSGFKRRFRAPLRPNQAINYPIQSTASDFVTKGMARLCRKSVELKQPWIRPVLNIHDDLPAYIPEEYLAEAIQTILETMLDTREYDFLPVPLLAEVTIGDHWGLQKEFGEFSSQDFYGIPFPLAV